MEPLSWTKIILSNYYVPDKNKWCKAFSRAASDEFCIPDELDFRALFWKGMAEKVHVAHTADWVSNLRDVSVFISLPQLIYSCLLHKLQNKFCIFYLCTYVYDSFTNVLPINGLDYNYRTLIRWLDYKNTEQSSQ